MVKTKPHKADYFKVVSLSFFLCNLSGKTFSARAPVQSVASNRFVSVYLIQRLFGLPSDLYFLKSSKSSLA